MPDRELIHAHFERFSTADWAHLRADEKMTLNADDLDRLRAMNDPISLSEAEAVYLPISRLLSLYVEAVHGLHAASAKFLNNADALKTPFIIGVSGSVAVGKSTTARVIHALMQRWPSSPKVDLVTTDGFLYPNAVLDARGLSEKKGFPQSYDRAKFLQFLSDVKSGKPQVKAPVYSHLEYDILEGEFINVDQPDILIVEGLNLLQADVQPGTKRPVMFASDFVDFGIYVDAKEADIRRWFLERFQRLRETAFRDPNSFFHQYALMTNEEAMAFGTSVWEAINLPNLEQNILPTRGRADLILSKSADHSISEVILRKI